MAIETKDLLTAVKAYARAKALPLDKTEVHESLASAQAYAEAFNAYAGQTIKVLQNGKYISYVLDPKAEGKGYNLTKVGVDASEVKTTVQVVAQLPGSAQEQGVIYVNTTDKKGYIWNGSGFVTIFEQVDGLADKIQTIEDKIGVINGSGAGSLSQNLADAKAYTDQQIKTVYTKEEVNQAIANAGHLKREIVTSLESVVSPNEHTIYMLPISGGSGNQMYEEFMYINAKFEKIGDTKVDLKDYATTASVNQAKQDAITAAEQDATTKANQAKADAIAQAATDATTKANQAKADAIADAAAKYDTKGSAAQALVDAKAYTDAEVVKLTNNKITPLEQNLQTKADQTVVDEINGRFVGMEPKETVPAYVGRIVSSGGTSQAEAIQTAKNEAIQASKTYTDQALTIQSF